MTDAAVFWESGKYAVVLILGLSQLHHRLKQIPTAPLLYLLLLLPSSVMTWYGVGMSAARELISFNLSGPFTLFISAWYFSGMRINRTQLVRILLFATLPIVTTATYALLRTFSAPAIQWVNDSMFQTSGGFGPNQVSTIMGLGIVAAWIILLLSRSGGRLRLVTAVLGIVFFIQGLLTFSRGGMIAAVIVVSFMALHAATGREQRTRLFLILLVLVPVVVFVVFPFLDEFTQGLLQVRFTDPGLTNRDALLEQELTLFLENPVAGVGPGVGTTMRGVASHTEVTRMLAEHGMLGLASLTVLLGLAAQQYLRSRSSIERGLRGSLVFWSLAIMTNAAMRIAAITFMFGLAFADVDLNEQE
jgi:O-antigen ligase